MPSNPYDAKGLLIAAIESDDPVVFFEPKRIYNGPFDGDPEKPGVSWAGYYTVPLGTAEIALPGDELTIITYGTLVHVAIAAAEATGVDAEVIDVRTMAPLDVKTLADSVKKTGRCLVAHEATRFGGYGAELAATIQKECFYHLEAPIGRVAGWDTPYPHAFEWQYFPGLKRLSALPDLGEGTVESEIGEWFVKVGDEVREEDIIGTVMTDKAAVEVSSPVSGKVVKLAGEPGDIIAVGAMLVVIDTVGTADEGRTTGAGESAAAPVEEAAEQPVTPVETPVEPEVAAAAPAGTELTSARIVTSPAIRRRAKEADVDLALVPGSGPGGRIVRKDCTHNAVDPG
jgi:hypothetical protein